MSPTFNQLKRRYPSYFKFLTAIIILSIVVVILGGFSSGARVITITVRSSLVLGTIYIIGRLLIRAWATWEDMQQNR